MKYKISTILLCFLIIGCGGSGNNNDVNPFLVSDDQTESSSNTMEAMEATDNFDTMLNELLTCRALVPDSGGNYQMMLRSDGRVFTGPDPLLSLIGVSETGQTWTRTENGIFYNNENWNFGQDNNSISTIYDSQAGQRICEL